MFQTARIKLTSWYLLIIMMVSASFSMIVYKALTFELDRVEHMMRLRQERFEAQQQLPTELRGIFREHGRFFYIDSEIISETKQRIALRLFLLNGVIFALSS